MNYYIAVFWSRTEALSFATNLRRNGIPSAMISTPKEAGKTCGLSVKILPEYIDDAKKVMGRIRTSSFGGWFASVFRNGKLSIIRI